MRSGAPRRSISFALGFLLIPGFLLAARVYINQNEKGETEM